MLTHLCRNTNVGMRDIDWWNCFTCVVVLFTTEIPAMRLKSDEARPSLLAAAKTLCLSWPKCCCSSGKFSVICKMCAKVLVSSERLNLNDFVANVSDPAAGAISTFIGTTRNTFGDKDVLHLEYEAYEPMAVKVMQACFCKGGAAGCIVQLA